MEVSPVGEFPYQDGAMTGSSVCQIALESDQRPIFLPTKVLKREFSQNAGQGYGVGRLFTFFSGSKLKKLLKLIQMEFRPPLNFGQGGDILKTV